MTNRVCGAFAPLLRLLALTIIAPPCAAIAIPPATGKYHVGRSKHVVDFYNTNDPVAPGNISTSFLATLYYPTLQEPDSQPYLDPVTAELFEDAWNFSSGLLASLTSSVQWDAPFLSAEEECAPSPVLIFGPGGGGPPSEAYTILLSQLASQGYVIAALDHTYEQPFVRYPNGTGVYGLPVLEDFTIELVEALYEVRLNDTLEFARQWPALARKIGIPARTSHLGAFGHSLGGAVGIGAAVATPLHVVASGLNMDGTLFGAVLGNGSDADAGRPLLDFGQEAHVPDNDPSWGVFPDAQTGWWRTILVNETGHLDFSDAAFWKGLGPNGLQSVGTIKPERMVQVQREFVSAFFNQTLRHVDEEVLTTPGPEWPEVFVYDGSCGISPLKHGAIQ